MWAALVTTALQEASAQGLTQTGRIIAETAEQRATVPPGRGIAVDSRIAVDGLLPIYAWYGDRSVLKDNAVFYLHNGKVLSSLWGENKGP